jgi:HK97 family phage prohead protease
MIERRFVSGAEVRAEEEGKISGHAAVFDQEYVMWDSDYMRIAEVIRPGAFKRALKDKQDVACLFNHDANQVLGRSSSGTLTMKEDDKGLQFSNDVPDTTIGRDVRTLVKRGDIKGCSFAFTVNEEVRTEEKKGNKYFVLREIKEIGDLYDVGPVTYPAYSGTDVKSRAVEMRSAGISAEMLQRIPELRDSVVCEECKKRAAADPDGKKREGGPNSDSVCECTCAQCQAGNCAECSDPNYEGDHDNIDDNDDRSRVLDEVDARLRLAGMKAAG